MSTETIDFPAIEDLLGMEGFFSKYNVMEDLKAAGFSVGANLAYDLLKVAMVKLPWLGPKNEWYFKALKALIIATAGTFAGYQMKQRVGRDAGLIFSATVLGKTIYDTAVVPVGAKFVPSIPLGTVEVEDRALLGELTIQERRMLLGDMEATSVEPIRRLPPAQLADMGDDDDNEVVIGGGFNPNHGSLAAVLSY